MGKNRLENISQSERSSLASNAIIIIKEKWFFGTGLGNYIFAEKEINPKEASWFYQPVHNTFLLIWAEIGFIGFFLFVAFLQFVFGRILEQARANIWELYRIGIILSIIFMMMFDHWWWSLHMGVVLFWFAFGLLYKEDKIGFLL
jgi:O-antigen ligase